MHKNILTNDLNLYYISKTFKEYQNTEKKKGKKQGWHENINFVIKL